jgi:hypothetical protein
VAERDVQRSVTTPHGPAPVMGDPWHFSGASVAVSDPPAVGSGTRDVLKSIGRFTDAQIDDMIRPEAIPQLRQTFRDREPNVIASFHLDGVTLTLQRETTTPVSVLPPSFTSKSSKTAWDGRGNV